jgi:hypothetical protein
MSVFTTSLSGAKAAERFVRSDRLEDAIAEMHEGMRHYARETGLKIGREAAERALLLGLSTMPEDVVEWYARGGWRGRLEPYVAYWTENEELARRAGEAGWEVRQIQRPISFEDGVPKEWRTAYIVAPFGFDFSAVERAVVQYVDEAPGGVARVRPVEWPVPEAYLWFILKDRQPVKEGDQIIAYSIDRLSIEEPLSKFVEALRGRNFDEMKNIVRKLYEARFNRTLWQIVYEFDRERAEAALEYLRQKYGEPESRVWERHDELYLTWLAFRLADEFESYLRSGAGREFKTKEEFNELLALGRWLPADLTSLFWLRLVGDPEGEVEFKAAWVTAVNKWLEGMAAPYTPKKPAVARKAVELFNAFTGAAFKYEELFPPPKPAEAKREAVKPETVKPAEAAKPTEAKPVVKVEEHGLRREVEKLAAKPEAVTAEAAKPEAKPTEVKKPEVAKPAELVAEAVEVRGLRREEKPKAPIADVIPERVEAVEYLVQRFGVVLDEKAAFKAKDFVIEKVRARLDKVKAKEPEFVHLLAEVAEHVLSSFGRLMASPDAARHVYEALFYYFEGYQTRDGELLFARIERTVREAVRRAEEAGIPDAEYRIKQFILEIIDILATAGERYRRDALRAVMTVEKALRTTALAGLSAAALYSVYHGLYSEAVVSSVASAVALVEVGRFREAVEYVQRAAKALYEAAREVFEKVKVTVQRLVELFVEAVVRVLAWIDEHKAYLFLMATVAAGAVALSTALNIWGLIELEMLAYAASAPFFAGLAETGGRAAERFSAVAKRWKVDDNEKQKIEKVINEVINTPLNKERPYEALRKLSESANLPPPFVKLKEALDRVEDEVVQDAAVAAALVLYKTLINNAGVYREWAELYKWARGLVEKQEFAATAGDIKRLLEAQKRLEEAAEQVRRELNSVLRLYSQSGFYKERPDLLNKLKQLLEVDVKKAEELAEARSGELSKYSNTNMGTKAYAALLSAARGRIYGHVAMLFMIEGALADVVLLTPIGAYSKADRVAERRGETVDPSRVGTAGWEDRAASTLLRFLIGYGEADLRFRRIEKDGKKGFQVFRIYGGVEVPVGELWIGEVAYFKVSEEELRRRVEEAKRTAPDLSGLDKAPQYLEWLATDVTTAWRQIVAGTVHPWQLRWYIALLGEPKSFGGKAIITREGFKLAVIAYWPREREDEILRESRWLESLLGRTVNNWRELVDAIDWNWVLKRVEELADELKPWIGPEGVSDVEREGLVRRMLDELELFVHFAEARRGKNDNVWREEQIKMLAKAVEDLSGGRIAGDFAKELARLIIYYAEGRKQYAEKHINKLAEKLVGVSNKEVWDIVRRVLSGEDPYVYCLARDCVRDAVVRKFVAPALELIMLDKALRGEFDRESALLLFGEMYATAVAGDGAVGSYDVWLTVGGELGGGSALLRLATLHLLRQLLPDELKFNARVYIGEGVYRIVAYGEDAAKFKRLLAVSAPSAGGGYLSEKFNEFMKETRVEVRVDNIRLTPSGLVAADLTISEAGVAVKYNVYLRENKVELQFQSTDRGRAELAARLLKRAGVNAEVKKVGNGGVWQVRAATDALAAGCEELRKALAKVVETARDNDWVDERRAMRWLEKLEKGMTAWEGKKFMVSLVKGALVIRFSSTSRESVEEVAREFKAMGLEEGVHFTVKWSGGRGSVYLLAEGVRRLAWVSIHGEEGQRRRAAEFLKFLEEKARAKGEEVLRKLEALLEEGRSRGTLRLVGPERGGVKVLYVKTEEKDDKLYVTIKAEVDGAAGEYKITIYRDRGGARRLMFYVRGGEAVARAVKLIEVLTGERPSVAERPDGLTRIGGAGRHIDALARYEELREAIERWSNR